jgi:hypothetical protein
LVFDCFVVLTDVLSSFYSGKFKFWEFKLSSGEKIVSLSVGKFVCAESLAPKCWECCLLIVRGNGQAQKHWSFFNWEDGRLF